jgi:adenylosuccinate synthase
MDDDRHRRLPPAAYLCALEELSGCRVATGADRDDIIVLDDPFA